MVNYSRTAVSGTIDGIFNLVILFWQFGDFQEDTMGVSYGNPWSICQLN